MSSNDRIPAHQKATVNGASAVVFIERKTYVLIGENDRIARTLDGRISVYSITGKPPDEQPLLPSDTVQIEVDFVAK